ncbi:hypothetical protein FQN50_009789 [Emmonsiellopsis sp. PD_5]|nr:hypothetical protein FQN50_009789 [Emmonsiellopsis sp. PD_5]
MRFPIPSLFDSPLKMRGWHSLTVDVLHIIVENLEPKDIVNLFQIGVSTRVVTRKQFDTIRDSRDDTILHAMAKLDREGWMDDVVARTTDFSPRNIHSETPLHVAIHSKRKKTALFLMKASGGPTQYYPQYMGLFRDAKLRYDEIVDILMSGNSVAGSYTWSTAEEPYNDILFPAAARIGHAGVMRLLLRNDMRLWCEQNWRPATMAAMYGRTDVMKLFIEQCADVFHQRREPDWCRYDYPNFLGMKHILENAVQGGGLDVVKFFLPHFDDDISKVICYADTPPLNLALGVGKSRLVFRENIDGEQYRTFDRKNAREKKQTQGEGERLPRPSIYNRIARELIRAKADVNGQDDHGAKPLHIAARHGSIEMVRLLIDAGADSSLRTKNGVSPLAVALYWGHQGICRILARQRKMPSATTVKSQISSNEGQLAFEPGVKITNIVSTPAMVLSETSDGYWIGAINRRFGYFDSECVKLDEFPDESPNESPDE